MTKQVRIALAAAAALGGAALTTNTASAMPAAGLNPAIAAPADVAATNIDKVRYVCGPYRCFWRPGFYGWRGGYWGPRRYGWGWRRRWW